MFYNDLYSIYQKFGLILSQPVFLLDFLLDFYFKNLDFSATQLAHFDVSLITLFFIITFFEPILSICFLQLKQ